MSVLGKFKVRTQAKDGRVIEPLIAREGLKDEIVVNTPFARLLAVLLGIIGMIFTGIIVVAALRAVEKSFEELNAF